MNKEDASKKITGLLLDLYYDGRIDDKELADFSIMVANTIENIEVRT